MKDFLSKIQLASLIQVSAHGKPNNHLFSLKPHTSPFRLSLWVFLNLHLLLVAQISSCNLSGFVRELFTLCFLNRTLGNHKQVFPKLIKSKLLDSELLTLPQKGQNFLIPLKPISPSFTKNSLLLKKKMTTKYHLC